MRQITDAYFHFLGREGVQSFLKKHPNIAALAISLALRMELRAALKDSNSVLGVQGSEKISSMEGEVVNPLDWDFNLRERNAGAEPPKEVFMTFIDLGQYEIGCLDCSFLPCVNSIEDNNNF